MYKKYKGLTIVLCMAMIMSMSIIPIMQVNAEEITVIEEESWKNTGEEHVGNLNTSTIPPAEDTEITPRGTGEPQTSAVINLRTQDMTFAGKADRSKLYTNNNFTGASSIRITVTNSHDEVLTYYVYKNGTIDTRVKTITVQPGYTVATSLSGLNSSSLYYLMFRAPSHFSGSVKRIA